MDSKDALSFFRQIAAEAKDKYAPKLQRFNDRTSIDASFISAYLNSNTDMLDFGSGTGLIIEKLCTIPKSITCVEPFEEFSKFIVKDPRINVIHSTIQEFDTTDKFDIITLFGVMCYLSATDAQAVYSKVFSMLKPNGILIVKHPFGLDQDVIVNNFSEELGRDYYASYRLLTHEMQLLWKAGFTGIRAYDIYPPQENRWPDTHAFALVAGGQEVHA